MSDTEPSAEAQKLIADLYNAIEQHSWINSSIAAPIIDAALQQARREGDAEIERLTKLLNTPEILDFAKAVQLEAAHQRERWGSDHDAGKTDADWFWLIGFLAGKALHNPGGEMDKKLHRIITKAAAACNWHAAILGQTNMRPGLPEKAIRAEAEKLK